MGEEAKNGMDKPVNSHDSDRDTAKERREWDNERR
jgi:hypothetical protein